MLPDQRHDVGGRPHLGHVLVGDGHAAGPYRGRGRARGAGRPVPGRRPRRPRRRRRRGRRRSWPLGGRLGLPPALGRRPARRAFAGLGRRLPRPLRCRRRPAPPGRRPAGPPAPGRASSSRSRARPRRRRAIDSGSPPCSPHTPTLRSGRVARPRATPRRTSSPTPSASTVSNGLAGQQPQLEVGRHHPALDVVAAEAEGHLGQVVGAEGEEVGHLGDLAGPQGRPGRLDHRADGHLDLAGGLGRLGPCAGLALGGPRPRPRPPPPPPSGGPGPAPPG